MENDKQIGCSNRLKKERKKKEEKNRKNEKKRRLKKEKNQVHPEERKQIMNIIHLDI